MTSHELAKKLLEGPDVTVTFSDHSTVDISPSIEVEEVFIGNAGFWPSGDKGFSYEDHIVLS